MKLIAVTALALVLCGVAADKAFRGDLSHVVRVGRNGRQVISSTKGFRQGGQPRRLGRKVRRRQGRNLLVHHAAPHAAVHHAHHHAPALNLVPVAPPPLALPLPATAHFVHHAAAPVAPVLAPAAPIQAIAPAFAPAPPPAAPTPVVIAARAPALEYGTPATIAPEVRVQSGYLAPEEPVVEAARDSYLVDPEPVVEAARDSYIVEQEEPVVEAARDTYIAASEPVVEAVRDSYIAASEPVTEAAVVEAKNTYIAAAPSLNAETYVPRTAANVRATARPKPIAIVRSHINPPAETAAFDYAFETENGIKQEAVGTVRKVDDIDVSVMKGSYEFTGADGVVYAVDWYADETGFHASAPHLPKSVEPNHPEVAAAVRAQIQFAAEEKAAAASSRSSTSYAAPAAGGYGAPSEEAAVVDLRAVEPISEYGLPSYN